MNLFDYLFHTDAQNVTFLEHFSALACSLNGKPRKDYSTC